MYFSFKPEMNKWSLIFLGACFVISDGKEPFKPAAGSMPFLVYYPSRYRGLCMGTLVSRMAVLTAAVCLVNPVSRTPDTRPINVVTGTSYRHPRRGIRVQVTKVLLPKSTLGQMASKVYLMEKSVAIMLLKRKVPDVLAESPLRGIDIDWRGEETLVLHQDCFMPGWHFFYKGDKIYPVSKFLLQRSLRVQYLRIVKLHEWCDTLVVKMQQSLTNMGFQGVFDEEGKLCVKDPNYSAQPCHGMYGAPLICKARQVGMLLAPDSQWTNCTGESNLVHLLNAKFLREFMTCASRIFEPEISRDWKEMQKAIEGDVDSYDYIPAMYDKIIGDSDETIEETVY